MAVLFLIEILATVFVQTQKEVAGGIDHPGNEGQERQADDYGNEIRLPCFIALRDRSQDAHPKKKPINTAHCPFADSFPIKKLSDRADRTGFEPSAPQEVRTGQARNPDLSKRPF